jgi:hypothetical protein
MRGSNPVRCCSAVRGRSGGPPVTCDPHSPTVTARARRGPAVPDAMRTERGPRCMCHRELGKHPRTAHRGLLVQLSGRGHRPLLSVDDRSGPRLRARRGTAGEDETLLGRGGDGHQLGRSVRSVQGDTCLVGKRRWARASRYPPTWSARLGPQARGKMRLLSPGPVVGEWLGGSGVPITAGLEGYRRGTGK